MYTKLLGRDKDINPENFIFYRKQTLFILETLPMRL